MVDSVQLVQEGRPERQGRSSKISLGDLGELDRESEVPLYFQLAAALKVMLEVGDWEVGARFVSERELEERFNVSRAVVRPALELLVGDGAIFRVKGSGAFISPPRQDVPVAGLVRLSLELDDYPGIIVLGARERRPDSTVSHFLEIEGTETPITHVTAVVNVDQPSAFLVDSYSTADRVPWLLSTVRALQEGEGLPPKPEGVDLTRATVSVEHTFFGEWGSSQVGASAGDPALMGRFVQYGRPAGAEQERPLEFARLIYRADSAQLTFDLS